MPRLLRIAVALFACAFSASCNFHALPFGSANIHNREAMQFLRDQQPVGAVPGAGLTFKPVDDDRRIVGLAASGGGFRATAFTLGVLAELGQVELDGGPNALEAIDFMSSNSGGSWAVAAYLADRSQSNSHNYNLLKQSEAIDTRFAALSNAKVKCWSDAFTRAITSEATFRDIYSVSAGRRLPRVFFNASIMPAQTAFVFTDDFLEHFAVAELTGACNTKTFVRENGLADLPLGFVAATSGSVPMFTHSWARTTLCDKVSDRSFCFGPKAGHRNHLQLLDGGLYDNLGYKTAFEVARATVDTNPGLKNVMLFIDSADGEDHQTIKASDTHKYRPIRTLIASTFPHQHSTFTRMRKPMFESAGFKDQLLLDFNAAGGFYLNDAALLEDLPALAYFAANNVSCFKRDGTVWKAPKKVREPADYGKPADHVETLLARGPDCLSENFARAGYLHRTTYQYDPYFFRVRFELGRLVVKKKWADIRKALSVG